MDIKEEERAIAHNKQYLEQLQAEPILDQAISKEEQTKRQAHLDGERERWTLELQEQRASYEKHRVEQGRLKRQIARMSKTLGDSAEPAASVSSLSRRLERLEQKVDQIIETLAAKKSR